MSLWERERGREGGGGGTYVPLGETRAVDEGFERDDVCAFFQV